MNRILRPLYSLIAASALALSLFSHPVNADTQPDVRAQAQSLALATANSAISVPLNYGRQLIHWQIVTGATTNAADRIIFENSPDAGTTWDGATVLQSSNGTGTSTVLTGTIAAGSTFTPSANTTYDFWVPVNGMTQTRVRVSTNHSGDTAATVAYNATAGAVPAPIGTSLPVSPATTFPVSVATTIPVSVTSNVPVTPATTFPVSAASSLPVTFNAIPQPITAASTVPVSIATTIPVTVASTAPVAVQNTVSISGAPTPRAYATNASSQIVVSEATTVPVSGTLTVNTPAPAPTGTSGAVAIQATAYTHTAQANPSSSPVAIKASAGILGGVEFYNGAGVTNFLQIFDNVAGSITLGTTAPSMVLGCTTLTQCFFPLPASGVTMTTGITIYCTTTSTGSTGCATGTQLDVDYL